MGWSNAQEEAQDELSLVGWSGGEKEEKYDVLSPAPVLSLCSKRPGISESTDLSIMREGKGAEERCACRAVCTPADVSLLLSSSLSSFCRSLGETQTEEVKIRKTASHRMSQMRFRTRFVLLYNPFILSVFLPLFSSLSSCSTFAWTARRSDD